MLYVLSFRHGGRMPREVDFVDFLSSPTFQQCITLANLSLETVGTIAGTDSEAY